MTSTPQGQRTTFANLGRCGCECIGCQRLFWGVGAFDTHRTGPHGGDRRRMTDAEMAKVGLERDEPGIRFDATERRAAAERRGRTPRIGKVA